MKSHINLLLTHPHDCGYLPDRKASTLFVDPRGPMSPFLYERLAEKGFRRSGEFVYRPNCIGCHACQSVRLPVASFEMTRNLRRILTKNQDLEVSLLRAVYREEQYQLYKSYIHARHRGGVMDNPTPESYLEFLGSSWMDTAFCEFRLDDRLVMVAVVDHMHDSLSAVYTFFDPQLASRSLGTFAILWQIFEAHRLQKPWLYLGYYIPGCQKMQYKARFRPLEVFGELGWVPLHPDSTSCSPLLPVDKNDASQWDGRTPFSRPMFTE